MTTTTATNGRNARKSLSDQIDRLDLILDGLAASLNEAVAAAVATAVRDAVREAAAAAVHEVLTNEQLQRRLRELREPPSPPAPKQTVPSKPLLEKATEACRQATSAVRQAAGNAVDAVRSGWCEATRWVRRATRQAADQARAGCQTLGNLAALAWHYRRPLVAALAVGAAAGVAVYMAGPVGPAVACGAAGALGSLAASAWGRLRRLLPGLWRPPATDANA
jgi:hypothetical protein